jgi:hypothetical protein
MLAHDEDREEGPVGFTKVKEVQSRPARGRRKQTHLADTGSLSFDGPPCVDHRLPVGGDDGVEHGSLLERHLAPERY